MARILIADDDPHIRELVVHFLDQAGHATVEAGDGEEALAAVAAGRVDLAILDVMMPRMDGWQVCRRIKSGGRDLPVIMLTARGESSQKVRGFELGADDYVVKPFDPPELLARVKALLRRYRLLEGGQIHIGRLGIDPEAFTVSLDGQVLSLPRKEFELLAKLAGQPGRTFTRDGLLAELWGSEFDGTERTVDVHINRLRDRFAPETSGIRIETVRGLGYRLVGED